MVARQAPIELRGTGPEIFGGLVSALDDPDSQVRCAAIRAFESLGTSYDPKLLERLIAIARDTTTPVRRGASICRQDLASRSEGYVRKAVDERLRIAAIDCLANFELHAESVVPVLIDAIADGDPLTRLHAVSALGSVGQPTKSTVPAVIELLRATRTPDDVAKRTIGNAGELTVATKLAALVLLAENGCDTSAQRFPSSSICCLIPSSKCANDLRRFSVGSAGRQPFACLLSSSRFSTAGSVLRPEKRSSRRSVGRLNWQ